jgi:hypothetical protein
MIAPSCEGYYEAHPTGELALCQTPADGSITTCVASDPFLCSPPPSPSPPSAPACAPFTCAGNAGGALPCGDKWFGARCKDAADNPIGGTSGGGFDNVTDMAVGTGVFAAAAGTEACSIDNGHTLHHDLCSEALAMRATLPAGDADCDLIAEALQGICCDPAACPGPLFVTGHSCSNGYGTRTEDGAAYGINARFEYEGFTRDGRPFYRSVVNAATNLFYDANCGGGATPQAGWFFGNQAPSTTAVDALQGGTGGNCGNNANNGASDRTPPRSAEWQQYCGSLGHSTRPMNISSSPFVPADKDELKAALTHWNAVGRHAAAVYCTVDSWDVSASTDFKELLLNLGNISESLSGWNTVCRRDSNSPPLAVSLLGRAHIDCSRLALRPASPRCSPPSKARLHSTTADNFSS